MDDNINKNKSIDSNEIDINNKEKDNDKDGSSDNKSSVLDSKDSLIDDHKDNIEDSIQSSDEYNVDTDTTLTEITEKKKYKGKVSSIYVNFISNFFFYLF